MTCDKVHCDNCGKKLKEYPCHREGYLAYTTKGKMILCYDCQTFFKKNDKLPEK